MITLLNINKLSYMKKNWREMFAKVFLPAGKKREIGGK
jgi:hypothetical protein